MGSCGRPTLEMAADARVCLRAAMLIGTLFFVSTPGRAETSVADVTSQAKENWKRYHDMAAAFQGGMTVTTTEKPGGNILSKRQWVVRQMGPEKTSEIVTEIVPATSKEFAIVRNESYFFEIERSSTSAPWSIKSFVEQEQGSPPLSEQLAAYGHAVRIPTDGLRLYNKYLSDMLDEPGFAIVSAEPRDDGIVRLEFSYDGLLPNFPLTRGWVDLDTEHFFVIREYDSEAKWLDGTGRLQGVFDYSVDPDGFPRVTSVVRSHSSDNGRVPYHVIDATDFDLSRSIPVSKSDFTLSAFGLPEPPGPSRSFLPTSVFFWTTALLLVGLLSLMAAARLNR